MPTTAPSTARSPESIRDRAMVEDLYRMYQQEAVGHQTKNRADGFIHYVLQSIGNERTRTVFTLSAVRRFTTIIRKQDREETHERYTQPHP